MKRTFSGNIARLQLAFLALSVALFALVSCAEPSVSRPASEGPGEKTTNQQTGTSGAAKQNLEQFEVIRAAVEKYLESDKNKSDPNLKAEDLYYMLNDGDAANDPFIVSVRAAADYEKGHIPGAINIPWREIAKKENLAKLPKDRPIVVYCYTGQTGSQATAILNLLGYDVKNLKFGMASWTKDENIAPNRLDPEKGVKDYKVETTANIPTKTYPFPVLNYASTGDAFELIRAAADAYLSSARAQNTNIKAEDLFYTLNDGDTANDPAILSVRSAADYAVGHVPGAVNVLWREVGRKENLAKLPNDKVIVVYCYTGHTGSQTTALLNVLGYEARNLSHGIGSWTKDMNVVKSRFDNSKDSKDYKFVVGTNPK